MDNFKNGINYSDEEHELEWDAEISKEGREFIILPEGVYDFKVQKYERSRYNGSAKIPPCNQVTVYLEIQSTAGIAVVRENLYLHTVAEWKLCEFFNSIGQKKKGEAVRMNWQIVSGATGRAEIEIDKYNDKNGKERTKNKVKKFLPKEQQNFNNFIPPQYNPGKF